MAISINHLTHVIAIPKADTTYLGLNAATGYEVRAYNEYGFMREMADYLDSDVGMGLPNAFAHNTTVNIAGVSYARAFVLLAPYTITFENGTYQVKLTGGMNNNMLDVLNPNNVSVIAANSAGLQQVTSGSGVTLGDKADIINGVWSHVVESLSAEQMLRVMLAAMAGKTSGLGSNTEFYLAQNGITPRISADFDTQGNRTNVVLDGG